ncbi:hypothetical protein [Lactobacillus terrae]|uniref:hypothetical protein n=1 Tax=Lactobacillus terrae TaxID=2269374 RepID=UPI000C1B6073|nr:hypothetical protein [Lactobacillus terrae]
MKSNEKEHTGIGFCGLLTLIFVIAKITGFITWSWWLVFLPVFIPLLLALLILGVGGLIVWMLDKDGD